MAETGVISGQEMKKRRQNEGRNGADTHPQMSRKGMREEGKRLTMEIPTEVHIGSTRKKPSTPPVLRPKVGKVRPVPIRQSSIPVRTEGDLRKDLSTPRVLLSSSNASPQVCDFAYPRLTPVHAYSSTSEATASLRQNLETYSSSPVSVGMRKEQSNIPVSGNKEKATMELRRVTSGFLSSVKTTRTAEKGTENTAETSSPAVPLTKGIGLGTPVAVRKVILEDMAEMRAQWKRSLGIPLPPSTPIKTAQLATTPGPRAIIHEEKKVHASAAKQTRFGVKSKSADTVKAAQREHTSTTLKTARSIPQAPRIPIFNLPHTSCELSPFPSHSPLPSSSTPKGSPSRISRPRGLLFGNRETVSTPEYDPLATNRLRGGGSGETPSKEVQWKLDQAIDRKIEEDRGAGRRFGQWESGRVGSEMDG